MHLQQAEIGVSRSHRHYDAQRSEATARPRRIGSTSPSVQEGPPSLFRSISEVVKNIRSRFNRDGSPTDRLLAQRKAWRWTEVEQKAFDAVMLLLWRPLILCRPDPIKYLFLQTDAAKSGMGAVLYQQGDDGDRRIVSYAFAKFTPAESKYYSNEQEYLVVVWALKPYRSLLEDNRFTLCIDNAALICLDRVQDERGKLTRWVMLLKRSSFNIEHVLRKSKELPDALSTQPGDELFIADPAEVKRSCDPRGSSQKGRSSWPSSMQRDYTAGLQKPELPTRSYETRTDNIWSINCARVKTFGAKTAHTGSAR
jgi:hypothetical protein